MLYRKFGKRLCDVVLSALGLVILSPVLLGISIAVLVSDPIIYKQKRMGKDGKAFYICKFRTMVKNADQIGPLYTAMSDSRITKTGRFLRKTSLDELPQLWNILKGDMSVVGPRPGIWKEYSELNENQKERLLIVPGLLCLADVRGRSLLKPEEKIRYDLEYVRGYSFWKDIKICIKGAIVVLKREGVN